MLVTLDKAEVQQKNQRVSFDSAGAQEYLNGLGITLKKRRDAKQVLEALNSLEAGESISGRMGAAGLGQSVTQYLVTALGGKNSDFTATRGQKRAGTYDNPAAIEFIKSKLNIPEAGAVSEVQGSDTAVFTNQQTGKGDFVTDTFAQTFPEFEGLDKNQVISQVENLITSGEFAQRGFTQEQVTNIRTFLEQQNINNLDDMKQAVDQGVIQNPYLTSLSINLLLAGPDGMVGGESIADATEKMENFITTGISTRDAKELTDSVQTQRQIDSAALKDYNALLKTRFDQNREILGDLEEIGEDFAEDLDTARAYIRDPKNADAEARNTYIRVLNQDNYYSRYSDIAGGLGSYEQTDAWKNSPLGKTNRRPTVFDHAIFLAKSEAGTKALGPKAARTLNNNIATSTDIAAEAMFSKMQGTANPFRLSEWLGDFARADETGGLGKAFIDRLVAVTDANGKIVKIAAKDIKPDGTILEAEESAFFKHFADNDIDLGLVQLVVAQLDTVGDKEFRTRN